MEENRDTAIAQLPALAPGEILVLTPWYPSAQNPSSGAFVHRTVLELAAHFPITVLHTQMVRTVGAHPLRELPAPTDPQPHPVRHFQLDVLTPAGTTRQGAALAVRKQLAQYAAEALQSAQTVHAHTGYPAGFAAAELLNPHARLVVTEHASYLPEIASWPLTCRGYAKLLQRAHTLIAVSAHLGATIRATWPTQQRKVQVVANPVPLTAFHPRPNTPTHFHTWGALGNLVASKRVDLTLGAFAAWAHTLPDDAPAQLRIIGDGPQRSALLSQARTLGVEDRVVFLGRLSPDKALAELESLDLLVHLSDSETFGLAPLEAVLSRVPTLVTATAGSKEVLAEAVDCGFAAFVPTQPSVEQVVGGVVGLEKTAVRADWDTLRADLVTRYGGQQVGAQLAAVLRGELSGAGLQQRPGAAGRSLRSWVAGARQLPRYLLAAGRSLIRYAR